MRKTLVTIWFLATAAACLSGSITHEAQAQTAAAPWRNLVNGSSLEGWTVLGGTAPFRVENGEIIGVSVPDSPNSFLSTTEIFGDFILEYEAKVDPLLNSGVMARGLSDPAYRDGVVHGYQVEIDSSVRAWSGGVYDEQRRGWLNPLTRNDAAQAAFKVGQWNTFRVEAIGNRIRTFVNGVPAANVVDDMTARGFIGLQVHSVPDASLVGLEARFRGVRILTENLAVHALPARVSEEEFVWIPNYITQAERAAGWRLLFDGSTTQGWRGARIEGFPERGWIVRDGVLTVESSGGGEARNGGDIVTTEEFANFELQVDFRLTPGANSGVKYFVDPDLLQGEGSAIGLEFQILDDALHPDAAMGVSGNRTIGSLYDLITATNLSEPDRMAKRVNPIGEWNRARLVVRGQHVEHWLNDILVVDYERGTQMFRALVAYSKYQQWPRFGEYESGPILLQDHGDEVSFRSIKIRPLAPAN